MPSLPVGDALPDAGPTDPELQKANHFAWNLRVNVAVELWWGLAIALVSTSTIVPVLLARLGASARLIALVPGISLVGYALLQLPSSYFTTRLHRKTGPTILVHLPLVAAWFVAGLVTQHLATGRPELARILFLGCLGVASLAGGVGIPLWADYLNRQTPARARGRFFGSAFAAGSVTGLLGGVLARWLIDRLGYPAGFAACFYVAAGAMLVGLLPYLLVREAAGEPTRFGSLRVFAKHVSSILRRRGNLRRLVLVRCIMEAGMMSSAFYAVRALNIGGFADSAAGTFTVLATAAGAPAMLLAGYFGDRYGFPKVMAAGGGLAALATGIGLLAPGPGWFYVLFLCSGGAVACDLVSTINLVMEMSPEQDKTVYQATYNTLLVPMRIAYPLLAGWLAGTFSLSAAFAVALPLQLIGALMAVFVVRDARGTPSPGGEPSVGGGGC